MNQYKESIINNNNFKFQMGLNNTMFKFTNEINLSDKNNCNNNDNKFGNYFQQCSISEESTLWGNNKQVKENCMNPKEGIPCHNIWNNQTKRKSIVHYDRK